MLLYFDKVLLNLPKLTAGSPMNKKNIAVFTALSYALTWTFAALFRLSDGECESIYGPLLASACMFVPLLAVVIVQ